jgi:Uma2 family endonuclease
MDLALRKFTIAEYDRMVRLGVIREEEHVELLDGRVVQMTPQGPPHAWVTTEVAKRLTLLLGERYTVRTHAPLRALPASEPEPDIAVVRPADMVDMTRHPATALLVVECSMSSLRIDRAIKVPIYARAGIPEYWIANIQQRTLEVYRRPNRRRARFEVTRVCGVDDVVRPIALRGVSLRVGSLFPPLD